MHSRKWSEVLEERMLWASHPSTFPCWLVVSSMFWRSRADYIICITHMQRRIQDFGKGGWTFKNGLPQTSAVQYTQHKIRGLKPLSSTLCIHPCLYSAAKFAVLLNSPLSNFKRTCCVHQRPVYCSMHSTPKCFHCTSPYCTCLSRLVVSSLEWHQGLTWN